MLEWPHHLEILALRAFSPPRLFVRLYGLPWYSGMLRSWVAGVKIPVGADVLEIGCGPGMLCRDLAERAGTVTGIDRSAAMVRHAAENTADLPDVVIKQGALPSLPCDDNGFDVVLGSSLINIVPDRGAALAEIYRVTRPGGMASLLFPLPGFFQIADLADDLDLRGFSRAALRQWAHHARTVDFSHVNDSFHQAGFRSLTSWSMFDGCIGVVTGCKPHS